MWFEKILRKFFRRNSVCSKCNSPSHGNILCEKCQEYVDYMENKKEEEIQVKEELKRRSWIRTRDLFLNNEDGNR